MVGQGLFAGGVRFVLGVEFGFGGQFVAQASGFVHSAGEEAAGFDQEMPTATGGIEHLELEDGAGVWIFTRRALIALWAEGFLHQEADKRMWRVVGTGGFASQADS